MSNLKGLVVQKKAVSRPHMPDDYVVFITWRGKEIAKATMSKIIQLHMGDPKWWPNLVYEAMLNAGVTEYTFDQIDAHLKKGN